MSISPIVNGDSLVIHGLDEHLKRVKRYVSTDYPIPNKKLLDGYKLFVARNQGNGVFGETLSEPIFAGPNELCTETYVVFGPFKTEQEMKNCWDYVKTKFFRAILGIRKIDQNASQSVYSYIPLISFEKSINSRKLYSMFDLSDDEVDFIEKNVENMN
jgi:site-specific DNA-methyltransferase (adenine-specific)